MHPVGHALHAFEEIMMVCNHPISQMPKIIAHAANVSVADARRQLVFALWILTGVAVAIFVIATMDLFA